MKSRLVVTTENGNRYVKVSDLKIPNEPDANLETLLSNEAVLLLQANLGRTDGVKYSACLFDEQNRKKAIIRNSDAPLLSIKIEDL